MAGPNRLELLAAQSLVTGLDYVRVHPDQMTLDVHFLRSPATLDAPLPGDLTADQVTITPVEAGDPTVAIASIAWLGDPGSEDVLRVTAQHPGGFSPYVLEVHDSRIDPYFRQLRFSFKVNCPAGLDCTPPCPHCPDEDGAGFPVDYQARDFWSLRRALLDFAAQRYPQWAERAEADVGVMLVEAMSALGDELAYYQDRVAREGYLETATQRRSVRRHARLVDYRVHDGLGATGWLDVQVASGQSGAIPAGTGVWALASDGRRVDFTVGKGLADDVSYDVDAEMNALLPHVWDEDVTCLRFGSTQLDLEGAHASALVFNDPPADPTGRWVLLQTSPKDPSIPVRRQMVRLTSVSEHADPLLGGTVTRVGWEARHAVEHDMELASLELQANLVPISAGETLTQRFTIGPSEDEGDRPSAVERQGRLVESGSSACVGLDSCESNGERVTTYLFSLPETPERGLVWLGSRPETSEPQIELSQVERDGAGWTETRRWRYRSAFIGPASSMAQDAHFTLDDGTWSRVVGYQRDGREVAHVDYASGDGKTVRFGDGEFGRIPTEGTVFQVTYRVDNGPVGNLPAEAVAHLDPSAGLGFVASVSNPLPTAGGAAPESLDEVRQLAPERFRADTRRAVRPEDYAAAIERLEWVQRAGANFRWTGSWLTAFVTPDPRGANVLTEDRAAEAQAQADRFRQAGRPADVRPPRYADIDLDITVCAEPTSFRDDVRLMVLETLFGAQGSGGFFSPDSFTFGTALDRSALEAAIQGTPGVLAVRSVSIRRRGWFDWRPLTELSYEVGRDEVIRVENDPDHPDHGLLTLTMEGGA